MVSPGATIGPYRIERQLGQGGMATVYLALDDRLDRYVAIKVIPEYSNADPTLRERFRREARAAARLRHPHIVTVYNFLEAGSVNGIVMEYVPGGTLRERMGRRFTVREVTTVLGPIADALDYAHNLGLIHRDVKPSNILLAEDGRPVLSDFGLVRQMDGGMTLTATAITAGTPEYIAPEQALGQPVTGAADIFSLALIAYEMLCGAKPYVADTPVALLVAHAYQDPRPPRELYPDIPPKVEAALLKGLARDPLQRFSKAAELITALAEGVSEPTIAVTSPGAQPAQPAAVPAATQTVYCTQCGARNDRSARFCADCGKPLTPSHPQHDVRNVVQTPVPPASGPAGPASPAWPPDQPARPSPPSPWSPGQASRPAPPVSSPSAQPAGPASQVPPGMALPYAEVGERFAATLIDSVILVVAWFVMIIIIVAALGGDSADDTAVGVLVIITAAIGPWLYYALLESSSRRSTFGQRALGLMVTDLTGNRVSFGRATGRYFSKYISGLTLGIGYLLALTSPRRQTLHDMIAGTLVLKGKP